MMGQCDEAMKDYAALEVIDPKHGDLVTLYPLAKSCAERFVDGAAAESRRDWQVTDPFVELLLLNTLTSWLL